MSGLIDVSTFCGAWPFRRLRPHDPPALKKKLQAAGVTEAWMANAEAILHPDPMPANADLAETTKGDDFFRTAAVLDLSLSGWRADAEHCLDELGFRAFKLFPNYHSYALDTQEADALAELAAKRSVPVCIQIRMEDERSHHPLMKVPNVEPEALRAWTERHPATRFLTCGAFTKDLKALAGPENLFAETSFNESGQALRDAVTAFGARRLCFASFSPFFVLEAGLAKLDVGEQDVSAEDLAAIRGGNAQVLAGNSTTA